MAEDRDAKDGNVPGTFFLASGGRELRRRRGATDRVVCALFSVLCSLDIVKRVVTVKQVRRSPALIREVG
jgi:hypothetical protein